MTAPHNRDRTDSTGPVNPAPVPPASAPSDSLASNPGYAAQATNQRLPSESLEDYRRRRQALEQEAEVQRLALANRNAKAARINRVAERFTNAVYFLIIALESLLALRLILRIAGANRDNSFAQFIYSLSTPFVAPFSTLFVSPTAEGARYIFDVNLLVAMLVYALLGLLVGRLIKVLVGDTAP